MVNSEDFIKRLEKILDYYSLSASVFADKLGVQRSGLSHLLSGRNKPSLDFVMKITENFPDVDLYWLLNGKGSFPKKEEQYSKSTPPTTEVIPDTNSIIPDNKVIDSGAEKEESYQGISIPKNTAGIARIVIFYNDGTFHAFNEKE